MPAEVAADADIRGNMDSGGAPVEPAAGAVAEKQAMAEAAEQLLAGTGWLPTVLGTERPQWLDTPQDEACADAAE